MLNGVHRGGVRDDRLTYCLLVNRDKLEKLTGEIRGAFVSDEEITVSRLVGLANLNACLEESLRMYPPVPIGLPRIVPPEGKRICGEAIPGSVSLSIYIDRYILPT